MIFEVTYKANSRANKMAADSAGILSEVRRIKHVRSVEPITPGMARAEIHVSRLNVNTNKSDIHVSRLNMNKTKSDIHVSRLNVNTNK